MNLTEIIKPFFSDDDRRPLWQGAMFDGQYGYATNGHCCIRWKDDQQKAMDKIPNFDSVYNVQTDTDFTFFSDPYLEWKHQLEKVFDFTKCEYCKGEGEVTWEFEHFTDIDECPHCEGEGGFYNSTLMVPNPKHHYEIHGKKFNQHLIDKVINVMKCFNVNECKGRLQSDNKLQAVFFYIDQFDVLIMPVNP